MTSKRSKLVVVEEEEPPPRPAEEPKYRDRAAERRTDAAAPPSLAEIQRNLELELGKKNIQQQQQQPQATINTTPVSSPCRGVCAADVALIQSIDFSRHTLHQPATILATKPDDSGDDDDDFDMFASPSSTLEAIKSDLSNLPPAALRQVLEQVDEAIHLKGQTRE